MLIHPARGRTYRGKRPPAAALDLDELAKLVRLAPSYFPRRLPPPLLPPCSKDVVTLACSQIYQIRKQHPDGAAVSNKGGWQSPDLLDSSWAKSNAVFKRLVREVTHQIRSYADASAEAAGQAPARYRV